MIGSDLACLALIGVGAAVGLLAAGGVLSVPGLRMRRFPGLEWYAGLGAPLLLGAASGVAVAAAGEPDRGADRGASVVAAVHSVDGRLGRRAPSRRGRRRKALAQALPPDQTRRDVRVATFAYYQPSLIFYCQREVACLDSEQEAVDFLRGPLPSYLFLPAAQLPALETMAQRTWRLLTRRYDLYDNCDVVVVTNE